MSPLEQSILAEELEHSIHNLIRVYCPFPISEVRTMSRLAYRIMRQQLGRKRRPHLPVQRGPKPRLQ